MLTCGCCGGTGLCPICNDAFYPGEESAVPLRVKVDLGPDMVFLYESPPGFNCTVPGGLYFLDLFGTVGVCTYRYNGSGMCPPRIEGPSCLTGCLQLDFDIFNREFTLFWSWGFSFGGYKWDAGGSSAACLSNITAGITVGNRQPHPFGGAGSSPLPPSTLLIQKV